MHEHERAWEDDELRLLRETCRSFFAAEILPNQERWQNQRYVDRSLWTKMGDLGLLCCGIPAEYGGGGGTLAHEIVVIEELARTLETGFGYGIHSIVAEYLDAYGSEEQKRTWLPELTSGRLIGAIAMTEPGAGSDLKAISTTAQKDGSNYIINGSKTFITNGGSADLIIVAVRTPPEHQTSGLSLLMVDARNLKGFSRGPLLKKIGQHSSDTCELFFDDVVVAESSLIGDEGAGFQYLMQQLPRERLIIAATAEVATTRAVELTIEYAKTRQAFGKPLFELQNTRFLLAECATLAHASTVFFDSCLQQYLNGDLDTATASMAKWWLTDVQCQVIDQCLQVFGGYGYMEEYPIARMYTDARVQKIYGGSNEIMKELIARNL
jgi:acyl-CoA dehydrogenase